MQHELVRPGPWPRRPPVPDAEDLRGYAEWYAWAFPEWNDVERAHTAAAAAITALRGGAGPEGAAETARQAAVGMALAPPVNPSLRTYAEWYVWVQRDMGLDEAECHVATAAAWHVAEDGGGVDDAMDAARAAAPERPSWYVPGLPARASADPAWRVSAGGPAEAGPAGGPDEPPAREPRQVPGSAPPASAAAPEPAAPQTPPPGPTAPRTPGSEPPAPGPPELEPPAPAGAEPPPPGPAPGWLPPVAAPGPPVPPSPAPGAPAPAPPEPPASGRFAAGSPRFAAGPPRQAPAAPGRPPPAPGRQAPDPPTRPAPEPAQPPSAQVPSRPGWQIPSDPAAAQPHGQNLPALRHAPRRPRRRSAWYAEPAVRGIAWGAFSLVLVTMVGRFLVVMPFLGLLYSVVALRRSRPVLGVACLLLNGGACVVAALTLGARLPG